MHNDQERKHYTMIAKNNNRVLIYIAIILVLSGYGFNNFHQNKPVTDSAKGFAIVELFTSEGCSSCPAADALAAVISAENNKEIYFLSFHVDYWNQYGWKDGFSSNNYTVRQEQYAGFFKLKSIYTPQVVVNGKTEFVGSNESKLRAAIQKELKSTPSVTIDLQVTTGIRSVAVSCSMPDAVNSVLNIALVQKQAEIAVRRGENEGKTLKHINIVRSFKRLTTLSNDLNMVTLYVPEGLSLKDLKVVAYLQDKDTYKVTGVALKNL